LESYDFINYLKKISREIINFLDSPLTDEEAAGITSVDYRIAG
jgi:hypothetical protein